MLASVYFLCIREASANLFIFDQIHNHVVDTEVNYFEFIRAP